jgi:glyoxylase-like metal-dependent hydrolase (beta-lactamase superfamily II)
MKKHISIKEMIDQRQTKINSLNIKTFPFNFLQVNSYLLYDDTKEAVLIDAGNAGEQEDMVLANFIAAERLTLKYIISTHPHIDHVLGNSFCKAKYPASQLLMHQEGMEVYKNSVAYGVAFGFDKSDFPAPDKFIKDGDTILYGNQQLEVIYTPGHCAGSICLIDNTNNLVFVGDVLFDDGIGRTDLPTGNYKLLIHNITTKLFTLNDNMVVYTGHGFTTTIGKERVSNSLD